MVSEGNDNISLVIPAYNEASRIRTVVSKYESLAVDQAKGRGGKSYLCINSLKVRVGHSMASDSIYSMCHTIKESSI